MAKPKEYTLVRLDDSIPDKAVLSFDADNDLIVDSGLITEVGEVRARAGTVAVGLQEMSSSGDEVSWRNMNTQVRYAPPWHVIDEVNPGGSYDKYYGNLQTLVRQDIKVDTLESPSFNVHIAENEVVFRLHMDFPESRKNVEFQLTQNDHEVWRDIVDIGAGEQVLNLDVPITFYPGDFLLTIKPYYKEDAPIRVLGDLQTGVPYYKVTMRPFTAHKIATENYVNNLIGDGSDSLNEQIKALLAKLRQDVDVNSNTIATNKSKLVVNNDKIEGLINEIHTLREHLVTKVTGSILPNTKTIRVSLETDSGVHVDSVDIDLASIVGSGGTPDKPTEPDKPTNPDLSVVRAGFSDTPTMTESQLKFRTTLREQVNDINNRDFVLRRTDDNTQKYLWVWSPLTLGPIRAFEFGGLSDYWDSSSLSVNGIAGTLYMSTGKTYSPNVDFKAVK